MFTRIISIISELKMAMMKKWWLWGFGLTYLFI